jgi:hypothetical protein
MHINGQHVLTLHLRNRAYTTYQVPSPGAQAMDGVAALATCSSLPGPEIQAPASRLCQTSDGRAGGARSTELNVLARCSGHAACIPARLTETRLRLLAPASSNNRTCGVKTILPIVFARG